MKPRPGRQDLSLNVVRLARSFHGRCVITPPRHSLRKDERSPAKSVLSRVGVRGQLRLISNFSRRGAWEEKCLIASGGTSPRMVNDLSRRMCGVTRESVSLRWVLSWFFFRRIFKGEDFERRM
jgi:hypothetical protein